MEVFNQNVFTCDSCSAELSPNRDTRIHCIECENYDTCWDCHMNRRTSGTHEVWHRQQTIPPDPSLPITAFHPLNPIVPYASAPGPYWGYMITQEKNASELFVRLADAIYTYIDLTVEPRGTSWLEPEKCCVVLDLLGYTPEQNAFRSFHLESQHNNYGIAWCDEEVAFVYRQYGWDHTLVSRASMQLVQGQRYDANFCPALRGMPVLSRKGFTAMMLGDALCNPDDFCARLNRLLISIPPLVDPATMQCFARQDVPRNSWPAVADPHASWESDTVQKMRIRRSAEQAAAAAAGVIYVPNTSYPRGGNRRGLFDGKPQGPNGFWYYQQEFS